MTEPKKKVRTKKVEVTPKKEEVQTKLRIKVRAFDHNVIDQATKKIMETLVKAGAEVKGPIPLPTEMKRYVVNRSTFIDKDSRDQYEIRVHHRLIDITNPNPKAIDALTSLQMPAGVDIEVKM